MLKRVVKQNAAKKEHSPQLSRPGLTQPKRRPATSGILILQRTPANKAVQRILRRREQTAGGNPLVQNRLGHSFAGSGPIAFVTLNESSNDALLGNLSEIEETIVHETIHIFSSIVEAQNAASKAGKPVDRNLDPASYAKFKTSLETALLPFVKKIRKLPSFSKRAPYLTAKDDAAATANTFLGEAIGRTEAAIFVKQRGGKGFAAADLRTLPLFFHADAYWSPTPPVISELKNFIKTNEKKIDAAVLPIILQAEENYLNLRP